MEVQYKKSSVPPRLIQMSEPSVSALHHFNKYQEGRTTMAFRIRYVYASLNIIRVMTGAKGLILYRELVESFGFQSTAILVNNLTFLLSITVS